MANPKGPIAIAAAVAGAGGYAPQLIEEQSPVADAQITFLSIPQTFQNLLVEFWVYTSTATTRETMGWWVNNFTNVSGYYLQDRQTVGGANTAGHAGSNNAILEVTGNAIKNYGRVLIPNYKDPASQGDTVWGISEAYWSNSGSSISQLDRLSRVNMNTAVSRLDFQATGTLTGLVRLYGVP